MLRWAILLLMVFLVKLEWGHVFAFDPPKILSWVQVSGLLAMFTFMMFHPQKLTRGKTGQKEDVMNLYHTSLLFQWKQLAARKCCLNKRESRRRRKRHVPKLWSNCSSKYSMNLSLSHVKISNALSHYFAPKITCKIWKRIVYEWKFVDLDQQLNWP